MSPQVKVVLTAGTEKLGYRAAPETKGSPASMGRLTRENQGPRVRPDLRVWLGRRAPRETKATGGSVAPLGREVTQGPAGSLDILVFRAEWVILD